MNSKVAKTTFKKTFLRALFELLIVFFGVFAAFWVDDYKVKKTNDKNRVKAYQGLLDETTSFLGGGEMIVSNFKKEQKEWRDSFEKGQNPSPIVIRLPGIDRPPNDVWEATKSSNIVSLFEPELLFKLSEYYNGMETLLSQFHDLRKFGREQIIPFSNRPETYYLKDNELQPTYQEYVNHLEEILSTSDSVLKEAKELQKELDIRIKGKEN